MSQVDDCLFIERNQIVQSDGSKETMNKYLKNGRYELPNGSVVSGNAQIHQAVIGPNCVIDMGNHPFQVSSSASSASSAQASQAFQSGQTTQVARAGNVRLGKNCKINLGRIMN